MNTYVRMMVHKVALGLALLAGLGGCSTLRQFAPSVEVRQMTAAEYIAQKRGDVLNSGNLSASTIEAVRVASLDEGACASPGQACIDAMYKSIVLREEDKRSAMAELWLQQALSIKPAKAEPKSKSREQGVEASQGAAATAALDANFQPRLDAWMEVARESYAYLFFTERTAGARAFEDRKTQVRDYYNLAVQEAATLLFDAYSKGIGLAGPGQMQLGRWRFAIREQALSNDGFERPLLEVLPASSMAFDGTLRSVHRRDGFGAELVAVMGGTSVATAQLAAGPPVALQGVAEVAAVPAAAKTAPEWSELPSPPITALMRFAGNNLPEVLADNAPELDIYDPYEVASIEMHGQRVPLAANFTAGYGLWLARSNFSKQALSALFGREGGVTKPHLFMMQPYDPNRRVLLMIHGLASSPEAWVNVANELMRDDAIRQEFQIWQFYYPTSMPVPLAHDVMRKILADVMQTFDPAGKSRASRDMVLVGHSMGGVISRLMVSFSGDALWTRWLEARGTGDVGLQKLQAEVGPMMHFEPLPQVERAVFIAAPHRGTEVAGSKLGRLVGRLVRLPLSAAQEVTYLLRGEDVATSSKRKERVAANSLDNLDKDDPFVKAAATLPIAPKVQYHSIIARAKAEGTLEDSSDGLVPYWSSHLAGAQSEKVIVSGHSVQEAPPAIVELRRILHADIQAQAGH